jgi:hypothetical protein
VEELDQLDHPCVWHLWSGRMCGLSGGAGLVTGRGNVNTRVIELDISVTFLQKNKFETGSR